MLTPKEIKELPSSVFQDFIQLKEFEAAIVSVQDVDDRDELVYYFAGRLIIENQLDYAERISRLIETWKIEQTWLLGDIAEKRFNQGLRNQAFDLLNEALPIARSNGRHWQRGESLSRLAEHFSLLGENKIAIEILCEAAQIAQEGEELAIKLEDGQDEHDSASVLGEVATRLSALDEKELAINIAQSITWERIKIRTLALLENS